MQLNQYESDRINAFIGNLTDYDKSSLRMLLEWFTRQSFEVVGMQSFGANIGLVWEMGKAHSRKHENTP